MSANFYELLKYAATGQASPSMTYYDRMRASTLMGGVVQTLTGQPPLTFKDDGTPLISWSMKGNGQQSGTPTPNAPIMPEFVGTLDDSDWTITITCAGQTVPVYLGKVQTVRRVKKLVLTGNEDWRTSSVFIGSCFAYLSDVAPDAKSFSTIVCTHVENQSGRYYYGYGRIDENSLSLWLFDSKITAADFKSYLADQYANGTPVTIWYVLAEPQTAIVNEPLRKIGDYADELHSEDAAVTIPTARGQNILTVDTDLQPSEMTITYRN